jgi:NADH-quinone oxidoreductase subunit C/D
MGFDLPEGWVDQAKATLKDILQAHGEINHLLSKNRIFCNRTVGAGAISRELALDYGLAGPVLRAAGVAHDLRHWAPYDGYDQFEWDVVVGHRGDTYDRYMVRMEEILQSVRILEQALNNIPAGPISVDDHRVSLPAKEDVYGNIEGLMNHFMLIIHGVQPPAGEIYGASEGANGELGFYVVSDGTGTPHRVKCRPPCFANLQALPEMVRGQLLSDAIPTLASINYIAGELDR